MAHDRETRLHMLGPMVTGPQAGIAANAEKIWGESSMVRTTAGGYLVKVGDGTVAATGPVVGIARFTASGGTTDGQYSLDTYHGVFGLPNSSTAPVTQASYGKPVYAEDDERVCSDPSFPVAGTMWGFTEDGLVIVAVGTGNASLTTALVLLAERTFTSGDFTVAGLSETFDIGSPISPNAIPLYARSHLEEAFDNGSGVSLVMTLGHDNDPDAYDAGFDCFTGSALEGVAWAKGAPGAGIGSPAYDGTSTGQIQATFTSGADLLTNYANGELTVQLWGHILP